MSEDGGDMLVYYIVMCTQTGRWGEFVAEEGDKLASLEVDIGYMVSIL